MKPPYIYTPENGTFENNCRTWIGSQISSIIETDGCDQLRLYGVFSVARHHSEERLASVAFPEGWGFGERQQYTQNVVREALATGSFFLFHNAWKTLHVALDAEDKPTARDDFNSVEGREDLIDWLCDAYHQWVLEGRPPAPALRTAVVVPAVVTPEEPAPDSDVVAFLRTCRLDGLTLHIPEARVDPKLYAKAKKAIEIFGGKWQAGKQCFTFKKDPAEKINHLLGTGQVVNEKKDRQAFYTPAALAKLVVQIADVRGKTVLEPSTGDGRLAHACKLVGASSITCVETDADECAKLDGVYAAVYNVDFLLFKTGLGTFDRVVMNPPFTKGADIKHVRHAMNFLSPGGILVAIMPDKDVPKLADLNPETVERFPAGAFKESGTMVATRVIKITKPS